MRQYLDLLDRILSEGAEKTDRTGTGTISVFGHQMRFDLQAGFPLLTTKKLHLKSIIYELLWFLKGDTNVKYLQDSWGEDLERMGGCRRGFGTYLRLSMAFMAPARRTHLDQIAQVVHDIKNNPDSRRLIVSAWNAGDIENMALAPCHALFQFYVVGGKLSCQLYQRSADTFLGVPFNIASYALLTLMMAQVCGLQPGEFVHTLGDAHIYLNHIEQVRLQLSREPRALPQMHINPAVKDIFGFRYEDFELTGYDPHPHIKGAISV